MKADWRLVTAAALVGALAVLLVPVKSLRRQATLYPGDAAIRYRFATGREAVVPNSLPALEERVKKQPGALELAELAGMYFDQGHKSGDLSWYDKAEATAKESLKKLATPNAAKLTLAKIADARHDFREAIRLAKEALNEKGSAGAIAVLVSSYLALGDLREAAIYADMAIEKRPDSGGYLMRALVLSAQGRDEEANFDFGRALVVEDLGAVEESARTRALWGRFLARRGEYAGAGALFDEALRIHPNDHLALALKGDMELRRGRYREAAALLIDAFTASKQMRYLIHYARAKALSGDATAAADLEAQAEALMRKELGEKTYGHRLDLAELLLDRARPADIAEAVALTESELSLRQSAEAYAMRARALFAAGRADEAADAVRAVLRTGVRDPEYFTLAGNIERARANAPRAGLYVDLALAIDPSYPAAREAKRALGEAPRDSARAVSSR